MFIDDSKDEKEAIQELEEMASDYRDSIGDGYWNYRIMKLEEKGEIKGIKYHDVWYEMREVYYDEKGEVFAWGERPEFFSFESIEDIKHLKESFAVALTKPILKIKHRKNGNEYVVESKKTFYDIGGINIDEKLF